MTLSAAVVQRLRRRLAALLLKRCSRLEFEQPRICQMIRMRLIWLARWKDAGNVSVNEDGFNESSGTQ